MESIPQLVYSVSYESNIPSFSLSLGSSSTEPIVAARETEKVLPQKGHILLTAYSPLGAKGAFWGNDWVMDCDILKQIAQTKGKSIAQVVFWNISGSFNNENIVTYLRFARFFVL